MKNTALRLNNAIWTTLTVLSLVILPQSGSAQANTTNTERRQFLYNLGFNDVSATIREKIAAEQYEHELNRRQMLNNIQSYEVINAARELSILMLENIDQRPNDGRRNLRLAHFAAKMLALRPLSPALDYPAEIMSMPQGEKRDIALVEWLGNERSRQMNIHKKGILADITYLLFADNIKSNLEQIERIDKLLTTIISRMYLDDSIGGGKYFGRALTALLVREDKLNTRADFNFQKNIKDELQGRYNLNLENFIGDTLAIPTPKGLQKVKVENGTMLLTRNLSSGSLNISWAAIPQNLVARWKARFRGLIGTPIATPLFVGPDDTVGGIDLWMRIRDRLAQGGILRKGFSHIVYMQVKEDPQTGIKMTRVIDNYPNRIADITGQYINTGGVRLTYPEQVIDLSHHSAVYIANPIPEKVQAWSLKNKTDNGYKEDFFPSIELELDGLNPVKNQNIKNWKTSITREEFNTLHSEKNAKKLSEKIMDKYVAGLEEAVHEGWTFHWPEYYDFYMVASTYCSQLGDMAMRKYVGMPMEQQPSTWHWALRFLGNVGKVGTELKKVKGLSAVGESLLKLPGVDKAMKLTNIKIISPTTLAMQPYMDGQMYRYESKSPEQRVQSNYMVGEYRENNSAVTFELEQRVNVVDFNFYKINPILDFGAAIRDVEYGFVMRASQGIKTEGFSTERMAEVASHKATPKLLKNWQESGSKNCIKLLAEK